MVVLKLKFDVEMASLDLGGNPWARSYASDRIGRTRSKPKLPRQAAVRHRLRETIYRTRGETHPSELVGVYLVGKAGIQAGFTDKADHSQDMFSEGTYWIGWTVFCLLAVIAIRSWATSDEVTPVEKPAVAIAAISFLI